jgi:hypothetical protein
LKASPQAFTQSQIFLFSLSENILFYNKNSVYISFIYFFMSRPGKDGNEKFYFPRRKKKMGDRFYHLFKTVVFAPYNLVIKTNLVKSHLAHLFCSMFSWRSWNSGGLRTSLIFLTHSHLEGFIHKENNMVKVSSFYTYR